MPVPLALAGCRVAILGLGLMGGSLALALRGHCREITGVDPDLRTCAAALERRVVDRVAAEPGALLPAADLLILAAPVRANLALIAALPEFATQDVVVIDLSSTKAQVCQALAALPANFSAVGGHPMCGKAEGGLDHAESGLFAGAQFALCSLPNTTPAARSLAYELVAALQAQPLWLDPHVHDQWVAATSHLPYLLANALAHATPLEAAPLAGPGFRSASRLATSSLPMMLDILATNHTNLLEALARFETELAELKTLLLTAGDTELAARLAKGARRQRLLVAPPLETPTPDRP